MFELPDAKRIRRSDFARSRSSSASTADNENEDKDETCARAEREAQLGARLAALYGPIEFSVKVPSALMSVTGQSKLRTKAKSKRKSIKGFSSISESDSSSPDQKESETEDEEEEEEQQEREFEFALFAHDKASPTTHKIILSNDNENQGPGRILRPRPPAHYFAAPATGRAREELEFAAVSGMDVLRKSRQRAWGLECQWRVRVLKEPPIAKSPVADSGSGSAGKARVDPRSNSTSRLSKGGIGASPDILLKLQNEPHRGRTRLNKKRRILVRERHRRNVAEEEARRVIAASREEAEKEKRVRRNREKKVKRRLKAKAKKAEGKGEEAEGHEVKIGEGGEEHQNNQ
ncbi:hypothetical protein BUE80_DR011724 [Diplocarpon rosae]|nr:hypothetical protein BUE80_DR011724 [Diplocarpon rosae]